MERLPRLKAVKRGDVSVPAHSRNGSPAPGGSTFTTSAPSAASSMPAYGPVMKVATSMTRTPASGAATAAMSIGSLCQPMIRYTNR